MRVPWSFTVFALAAVARAQRAAASDPCSEVARQLVAGEGTDDEGYVPAEVAVACLKAIPFDQQTSLDTIQNVRRFLAFYSAATYVEQQPTPELEMPPIDINRTLDAIEAKVQRGSYNSNFEFDRDVYNLFGNVHDGHLTFSPTCYSGVFKWEHDYPLAQVASSPDKLPEIYTVDVMSLGYGPANIKEKVSRINGKPAAEFLEEMAAADSDADWIDPDARYNEPYMLYGYWAKGNFAERFTYYETPITIEFASGETVNVEWKARYLGAGVPLRTSWRDVDSFYRLICLRTQAEIDAVIQPERIEYQLMPIPTPWLRPTNTRGIAIGTGTPTTPWVIIVGENDKVEAPAPVRTAYPKKDPKFTSSTNNANDANDGSRLSRRQSTYSGTVYPPNAVYIRTAFQELGYYVLDSDTAVLMVASFASLDESADEGRFSAQFSRFISDAISDAKKQGITRFLVDLTGNGGGSVYLGQDMARQFFPTSDEIFFGQNMRWNPVLSTMLLSGNEATINQTYFDIGHYLKPDGTDFASMADMLGPVYRDDDYFSKISIPDEIEANQESYRALRQDYSGPDPFRPENVVIITSGMCGSTCAIVSEAFTASGARTIAFGGRPRVGPMQGVGGIKGSQVLQFDDISYFISAFLPTSWRRVPDVPMPIKIRTTGASVNFRNSWRKDSQYLPMEWLYVPADWKVFYTPEMLTSLKKVHETARDVAWKGAKESSGGKYVPKNGYDGRGWRPTSRGTRTGSGAGWSNLGELIWRKMGRGGGDL